MYGKNKIIALLLCLLVLGVTFMPSVANAQPTSSCDRFGSCIGAFSCSWWAVRCAGSDPERFLEMTDW